MDSRKRYKISLKQDRLGVGNKLYKDVFISLSKSNIKIKRAELIHCVYKYELQPPTVKLYAAKYLKTVFTLEEALKVKEFLLYKMPMATVFLDEIEIPLLLEHLRPTGNKFDELMISKKVKNKLGFEIRGTYNSKLHASIPIVSVK